jgi:hypothetical protein
MSNLMALWNDLTVEEIMAYRRWAREYYVALQPINGTWHPVVQEECVQINREIGGYKG